VGGEKAEYIIAVGGDRKVGRIVYLHGKKWLYAWKCGISRAVGTEIFYHTPALSVIEKERPMMLSLRFTVLP
jgi:hypothetical protein